MNKKDLKEAIELIPIFIKMCENDVESAKHTIENPLTYEEYQKVQQLIIKLNNLNEYVDLNIFSFTP